MISFARVYIQVVKLLLEEHPETGIEFTELVLKDALKIWRRGSYYRHVLQYIDEENVE